MGKKEITWLGLIKLKLEEEKKKGKSPSIGDVTPLAKKEWVQIKEGKHPDYIQGKAQTFARKKKKSDENTKTRKSTGSRSMSRSMSMSPSMDIQSILSQAKVCTKCSKKIQKILKKKGMGGGSGGAALSPAEIGTSGCSSCGGQSGGCGCAVL